MDIILGIDVGNSDTKSSHTSTPSGIKESSSLPPETSEYLLYNNKYYIPSFDRMPYRMDKTTDELCLALTLIAISKELLFRVPTGTDPQAYISRITDLHLGVGLPPMHYSILKDKTIAYYEDAMSGGICYTYSGIDFSYALKTCKVFPQDYTAVMTDKKSFELVRRFIDSRVYAIDIGGITVDYIPIIKGKPDMLGADSIELGINKMFDSIIQQIFVKTGHRVGYDAVENVLNKKETVLPEDIKELIIKESEKWTNNIVDVLKQKGMDLWAYPAVFLGGGSKLLKPFLKANKSIMNSEFIASANANAKAYASAVKIYLKKG